jgi:hypothetical protein
MIRNTIPFHAPPNITHKAQSPNMLHDVTAPILDHQKTTNEEGRSASEARMTTTIAALFTSCIGSAPKPAVITLKNASIEEIITPRTNSAMLGKDSLVLVMDARN